MTESMIQKTEAFLSKKTKGSKLLANKVGKIKLELDRLGKKIKYLRTAKLI